MPAKSNESIFQEFEFGSSWWSAQRQVLDQKMTNIWSEINFRRLIRHRNVPNLAIDLLPTKCSSLGLVKRVYCAISLFTRALHTVPFMFPSNFWYDEVFLTLMSIGILNAFICISSNRHPARQRLKYLQSHIFWLYQWYKIRVQKKVNCQFPQVPLLVFLSRDSLNLIKARLLVRTEWYDFFVFS